MAESDQALRGDIDLYAPGFVHGWIDVPEGVEDPIEPTLWAGGKLRAVGILSGSRRDAGPRTAEFYFCLIDSPLRDSNFVVLTQLGHRLRPKRTAAFVYGAAQCVDGIVRGWAKRFGDNTPLEVSLLLGDAPAGSVVANNPISVQNHTYAVDGGFGFTIPLASLQPAIDAASIPRLKLRVAGGRRDFLLDAPNNLHDITGDARSLFDARFYRQQVGADFHLRSCFAHYMTTGRFDGLAPHPLFDPAFYESQLQHRIGGGNAFFHFLEPNDGPADPHPCFVSRWYCAKIGVVPEQAWLTYVTGGWRSADANWLISAPGSRRDREPLAALLQSHNDSPPHPLIDYGWVEGREGKAPPGEHPYHYVWRLLRERPISTTPLFDAAFYRTQGAQPPPGIDPLEHYLLRGERKGVRPNAFFDPSFYRRAYGDHDAEGGCLAYYLGEGEALGHMPCAGFDPHAYLEENAEDLRPGLGALQHFLATGVGRGNRPHPLIDLKWCAAHNPECLPRPNENFGDAVLRTQSLPHPLLHGRGEITAGDFERVFGPVPGDAPSIECALEGDCGSGQAIARLIAMEERRRGLSATTIRLLKNGNEVIARQYESFPYNQMAVPPEGNPEADDTLVSVVVPVWNRAEIIVRAIESIRRQSHRNLEIIVIDDGSTDGSADIVRKTFGADVILIEQDHRGVSAARNTGIEHANGTYIAYLDSDNTWEPRFLEIVLAALQASGAQCGHAAIRGYSADGRITYRGAPYHPGALARQNYIDINVFVHHRCLTDDGLRFDETLRRCVDWDFIQRLAARANGSHYVSFIGCNYLNDKSLGDRISVAEGYGDFFRVCLRGLDLAPHLTGHVTGQPATCLIVALEAEDDPAVADLLPALLWLLKGAHALEVIIVASDLSQNASRALVAACEHTTNLRVVHLWRDFGTYPAFQAVASLSDAPLLVFWPGCVRFDADAAGLLAQRSSELRGAIVQPNVAPAGTPRIHHWMLRSDGRVLAPVSLPAGGVPVKGVLGCDVPFALGRTGFAAVGGFDLQYHQCWALADLALRLHQGHAQEVETLTAVSVTQMRQRAVKERHRRRELNHFIAQWWSYAGLEPSGADAVYPQRPKFEAFAGYLALSETTPLRLRPVRPHRPLRVTVLATASPDNPAAVARTERLARGLVSAGAARGLAIDWIQAEQLGDGLDADVVLHLRMDRALLPVEGALNVAWLVGNPGEVSAAELGAMDHVFVPSAMAGRMVCEPQGVSWSVLLHATDGRYIPNDRSTDRELVDRAIFFGDGGRGTPRIVRDAMKAGLPLELHGTGWSGVVPRRFCATEPVPYEALGQIYQDARLVLVERGRAIREHAIIPAQIFEVLAAGGAVLAAPIEDVTAVLPGCLAGYRTGIEMQALFDTVDTWAGPVARQQTAAYVRAHHTLSQRIDQILGTLQIYRPGPRASSVALPDMRMTVAG